MKFGSQIQPGDIDYNNIKKLCGTQHFFESFNRELLAWKGNGEDSGIERNFLAGIKLLKKHQKHLIGHGSQPESINIKSLYRNNSIFLQHYQRLTHKFSRKYPEFFIDSSRSSTQIIAHRAFEPYLENLSNNLQLRHRTDWVEIDVNICKTGEIVLQHDRYHNNGQPLENITLSHLENPVTLRDLIAKWHKIKKTDNTPKLMIDVKGWNHNDIIKNINRILTDFHIDKNDVLIASFNQHYVIQSKQLGYQTAFITANREEYHFLHFLRHHRIDLIILDENLACKDAIDTYHQNSINVWVYTVNKTGRFTYLMDIGVDGIITDYPNLLC